MVSLFILLVWPKLLLSLDPDKAIHQYREDVWQSEDGLPDNSVWAISQTSDGYLWLGGYSGLARFDGVRFTTFDSSNTPLLKRDTVYALQTSRDGGLWAAIYRAGVARLVDGEWSMYTTNDGLISDRVWALAEGGDGSLWVGTEGGLSRFREGRWRSYTRRDGLPDDFVEKLHVDSRGDLWIGTRGGLSRFTGGAFRTYSVSDGLPSDHVVGLGEDANGTLWIGTRGGDLSRFDGSGFATYSTRHGLPGGDIQAVRCDRQGNLWLGTYGGGLVRKRGEEIAAYGAGDGFAGDIVFALFEDREGNLWVGTEGGGLGRLQDVPVTPYDTRDGLPSDRVAVVLEDRDGVMWIGTEGGGLARFADRGIAAFSSGDGLENRLVNSLFQHSDGSLWVGTDRGWSTIRNGRVITADLEVLGILEPPAVYAIEEDQLGRMWMGTYAQGLIRLDGDRLSTFSTDDGLPHQTVQALLEDRRRILWIGTDNGLARFEEGKGLAVALPGVSVTCLHEDDDGTLWIGTWDQGLYRHRDGESISFTTEAGLPTNGCYQILEDDRQTLWMSGDRGIVRVSKSELDDLAEGRIERLRPTVFDQTDGMKSRECVGGSQPAGCRTRDGRLWFATIRGLVSIDPGDASTDVAPPHPLLEQITVNGVSYPPESLAGETPLRLKPGRGELEVRFTGLRFRKPERISFRYRLEGYDSRWVEPGGRRVAYFTNLDPGPYRFEVTAANEDGVWSATSATAAFRITPRFYQTSWFFAAGFVAVLFCGWALNEWRRLRLVRRNQALEAIIAQRTAEVVKQRDELIGANIELRSAGEAAQAASIAKSEFLGVVSHELRTPLHGVIGMSDLLLTTELDDRQRDFVDIIRNSGNELLGIINRILDFTHIEPGGSELERQPFELRSCVEECLDSVAADVGDKQLELGYLIDENVPETIVGDSTRLREVLMIVLGNAVKFTPQGEVILTVNAQPHDRATDSQSAPETAPTAGLPVEQYRLSFAVQDNGVGIPREHLDRIFDAFTQEDSSTTRAFGGTGLGLAVAQRLVTTMGGKIWVESEVGRGSTFHFTILVEA